MSSRAGKGPAVRSYRRRKCLIDLNLAPAATENREQEGPSSLVAPQEVQGDQQPLGAQPPQVAQQLEVAQPPQVAQTLDVAQQPQVAQPPLIDVEAIDDDDVVESSPRAFAEAKNNSRRNRARAVVDLESDDHTRVTDNNRNKRRRETSNHTIINCDLFINLEGSSNSMRENVIKPPEPQPPKEPVFSCPICMGPLVEEMSTRCGHIFCKACIKAAISAQNKCPTCRKKVTVKELIRVFLPSTN